MAFSVVCFFQKIYIHRKNGHWFDIGIIFKLIDIVLKSHPVRQAGQSIRHGQDAQVVFKLVAVMQELIIWDSQALELCKSLIHGNLIAPLYNFHALLQRNQKPDKEQDGHRYKDQDPKPHQDPLNHTVIGQDPVFLFNFRSRSVSRKMYRHAQRPLDITTRGLVGSGWYQFHRGIVLQCRWQLLLLRSQCIFLQLRIGGEVKICRSRTQPQGMVFRIIAPGFIGNRRLHLFTCFIVLQPGKLPGEGISVFDDLMIPGQILF